MLSTPEKDEGGPRTRSHTTPTTSDRALESDRCAPRPRYARKKGLDKKAGYITSADDSKLEELMDILRFFEKWRCNLEEKTTLGDVTWKKHFITEYSWTDIRVSILGFVSMCRYLFEDDSRFKVSRLRDTPRYVNPRHHCQDVVENRFGHMRDGLGSHRN
ncbi:unnamed protein product, partial [Pylaiella littoralis]